MNDFTKEELFTIRDALRIMYKNGWDNENLPSSYDLHSKVCDIIAKLQELTQPEEPTGKYKVGDMVWFIDCGDTIHDPLFKIKTLECTSIEYTNDILVYILDHEFQYAEEQVYPTKQALIEAQIEYWQSLVDGSINALNAE